MTRYASLDHWEERYKKDPEPFDWFNKYAALKPFLLSAGLEESHEILMLGCGTSTMSESLWDDGFRNITNIDFSSQCINIMQQRCADKPGMTFTVLNVLELDQLERRGFDFVIDKGTLDCILCGEKSFENVNKALTLISQILKPGGVYMMISYGSPMFRLNHLQRKEFEWTVDLQTLEKPSLNTPAEVEEKSNVHYIYICKKEQPPTEEAPPEEDKAPEAGAS
ncbi:Os11g0557700 protein, related [Eimeria tenella]|uniref:Os11g0557700 protein, related n=1 Tax=Eimeria tenella TaxID=5802 RepID=U6L558_EIMTE|nr:Os11g0557700 protein, related [Eimeria tenella]CDJ45301.1 Os11g0557700 protein, related [Eimeria tenella]|eukprot:XP_013236047.1 Os11g0557700 protein, related [Eimeria tenella]